MNAMREYMEITAQVMREYGFKATIVNSSTVEVSARRHSVYPYHVMRIIESEELPIIGRQLNYACTSTFIHFKGYC